MKKPDMTSVSQTPKSVHEAIEQGIESAKSGNRLLARWQLETAAIGNDVRPEVWFWLAWVAESPVKAQAYLKHVAQDDRFGRSAHGGLDWLAVLTGDALPEFIAQNQSAPGVVIEQKPSSHQSSVSNRAAEGAGLQNDESVVKCPGCDSILFIRPSAIGKARICPACDGRFIVELDQFKQAQTRLLLKGPANAQDSDKEFASPVSTTAAPQSRRGETILVVDDSPTIRRVASMILGKNGYRVLTADTGEQGIAIAQMDLPSLILLDINMPGVDGYETCKRLRGNRSTRHIPIVMLSGNDGLFDQVRGYQAGSSKYLTKPCDAQAMLNTVRQLLLRPVSAKS